MKLTTWGVLLSLFLLPLTLLGQFPSNVRVAKFGVSTEARGVKFQKSGLPTHLPATLNDAYDVVDTLGGRYAYYQYRDTVWARADLIYQDSTPTPAYSIPGTGAWEDSTINFIEYTADWYRPSDSTYYSYDRREGYWKPKAGIYRAASEPTDAGLVKYSDSYWFDMAADQLKVKRANNIWYRVSVAEVYTLPTLNDTTSVDDPTDGYFAYIQSDSSLAIYSTTTDTWNSISPGVIDSAITEILELSPIISSDKNKLYRDVGTTDTIPKLYDARAGGFIEIGDYYAGIELSGITSKNEAIDSLARRASTFVDTTASRVITASASFLITDLGRTVVIDDASDSNPTVYTLPSSPQNNYQVTVFLETYQDGAEIDPDGETINGDTDNLIFPNVQYKSYTLKYVTGVGWIITDQT